MANGEIELLERVLFRLGTAETDDQLETAVMKFLTPSLLKITSSHESVRVKVMELLTHVNKRLKSRPLVQMPVEALLTQYKLSSNSFLQNFSIIYITMGFPRLTVEKQTELAPLLLNCLVGKSENHQDRLLILVLPLLGKIKIPQDPEKRKTLLQLTTDTQKQLLGLLQDVLLLPYGVTAEGEVPPGMSTYSFKRVIANNWKAEELEAMKQGIVRFICSNVFSDEDIFILLVLASADTRFSVATPALAELNKITPTLDWTDPLLSAPLYVLFTGNASKIVDRKTAPCSARVRQKLFQYLLKTRGKGINTAKGIQIIFEGLFGENTNQKCKVLALQFCENLIKDGPDDLIQKLAQVIISGLVKVIGLESKETYDVQNAAYCALAELARVCPAIVNKDLTHVSNYFNTLEKAPTEIQSSCREALIAIASAFKWVSNESSSSERKSQMVMNQQYMLPLLADYAESKTVVVQNVASTYLTTCFPEHSVPARYLLLVIAGERSSLHESIYSHLYGVPKMDLINYSRLESIEHKLTGKNSSFTTTNDQKHVTLPGFKEMINYVYDIVQKRSKSQQRQIYGKAVLAFSYETHVEILNYLRLCLWYSSGASSEPGAAKDVKLLQKYIQNNFKNEESNEIMKYLSLINEVILAKRGPVELACLYDVLDAAPDCLAKHCADKLEIFTIALKDVVETTRILVAQIYGIILAYGFSEIEFNEQLKEILIISQHSLEYKHGGVLAISHSFCRQVKRLKENGTYSYEFVEKWDELKNAVSLLLDYLLDQHHLLNSAAIEGLSLLGSITELPLNEIPETITLTSTEEKLDLVDVDDKKSKNFLFYSLFGLLRSAHSRPKIRENVATCLGHLAIGDGAFFTRRNLKGFRSLIKSTRDIALNIAIAQGITFTVLGKNPATLETAEMETVKNPYCDDDVFNWFMQEIIKMVPDPHPCSRHATGIWLLALVKNCAKNPLVYTRKQILQYAFTELLSDDSDFVQDVASRGLGLVFSLSDPNSQTDLANSLLDQLIGGKRQARKVNEDTQIFEEGVLGKTPMGGNITTYKELCSLASDLNQPEMIYQFMQLANHNAAWNSKLGAAFGLQSISKAAKEQMQPYLGKIVPRLYRYKYDPTPKIQNSMISIWDSVVSNSKETTEMYYWDIFDELSKNLTNVEWRVRIACCLAMRDLIKRPSGLKLRYDNKAVTAEGLNRLDLDLDKDIPEPDLAFLWSQLFRVMDDVHEGTRLAADGTCTVLSKICIVAASSDHGESAKRVTKSILPIILETGVTHTVPEIRIISMKALMELIDSSGSMLQAHLPTLIPCLLKATGELEIPKLSYLSTKLGAESEAQETIDNVRAEVAKQHSSMSAVDKCIRYIDYPTLEEMTPSVLDLAKNSVTLGTRIACAHFICLVCIRFGNEMQSIAGKYLNACFIGLKDKNTTVRKYFGSAIGHLVGIAKEQSIIKLFVKLTDQYFENRSNKGITQTIHAINKRHPETLKDYSSHVLPLIFFAMHDEINNENRDMVESWKELWIEVSPGDAGIKMNLSSMMEMFMKTMDDSSWSVKTQTGYSIATLAKKLGTQLEDKDRTMLINLILRNMSGRTFTGKESLLQALANLSKHLDKQDNDMKVKIVDAMMRECRKEEPVYRTHALRSTGDILEYLEVDRFEELYNMVWYLLDKKDLNAVTGDEDDKNITSEEKNRKVVVFITLKESVCDSLGKAWPANSIDTQEKYQTMFVERCVQCLQTNTRPVQVKLLVALSKFVDRLKLLEVKDTTNAEKRPKIQDDSVLTDICHNVMKSVTYVADIPHTGLKKESLNIVMILIKRLKQNHFIKELEIVKKSLNNIWSAFQKDNAPEIKCRLKDIDDSLKDL